MYLANPLTGITGLYRDLLLGLGVQPPFSRPRLVARIPIASYTAGPLFTDDAIQRIFEYAKGIPRRINQV